MINTVAKIRVYILANQSIKRSVSRQYYPTLSLVSKRFRSLLASPSKIYKVRSVSGDTESCLYVCFKFGRSDYRWYSLFRKLGGFALLKAPVPDPSPPARFSSLVAVGSLIYNIVGTNYSPETQLWDPDPIPCTPNVSFAGSCCQTACFDGKFHFMALFNPHVPAYHPKASPEMRNMGFLKGRTHCEIDNVLYRSNGSTPITWYDTQASRWRNLKGLAMFPIGARVSLANYGGRLAAFWYVTFWNDGDYGEHPDDTTKIWCAEIMLERRNSCEMWGQLLWKDHVLTVPDDYDLVKALAVTL